LQYREVVIIARTWYDYTTPDNADAYEALLKTEIFPGILARNVAGFSRIELLRGLAGEEAEFATAMWFDSLESVKAFAGADYETAVVLPKARALLKPRSRHYGVREERSAR
jgi:heme-degrading monooxygenase HmoA